MSLYCILLMGHSIYLVFSVFTSTPSTLLASISPTGCIMVITMIMTIETWKSFALLSANIKLIDIGWFWAHCNAFSLHVALNNFSFLDSVFAQAPQREASVECGSRPLYLLLILSQAIYFCFQTRRIAAFLRWRSSWDHFTTELSGGFRQRPNPLTYFDGFKTSLN
jgi:hypothetical protein